MLFDDALSINDSVSASNWSLNIIDVRHKIAGNILENHFSNTNSSIVRRT
ncbi:hypothetical protein QWZ13_01120 [Reinekea marina]|nr:hypothetical protein [Reinekea marina]MDN3647503.1 hypothetical protein [Reinekea marina]